MASMKRLRLSAVDVLPNYPLKLTFINGDTLTIPGEGWTVEWIDFDIQIGADILWLQAMQPAEDTRGWEAEQFGKPTFALEDR